MKLLITIAALLVSACSYQVRSYTLENAKVLCEKHGGVFHVFVGFMTESLRCNDGTLFDTIQPKRSNDK